MNRNHRSIQVFSAFREAIHAGKRSSAPLSSVISEPSCCSVMMSALLRRGIAKLLSRNSSFVCKYNECFSLSFSTLTENQPAETPNVYLDKYQFSPQVVSRAASVLSRSKNLERSESVLDFLKETGFTNAQLEKIVRTKPQLLVANVDEVIKPKLKIFHDLGFNTDDITKIISNSPNILTYSTSDRIIPTVSLLKGLVGSNASVAKLLRLSGWFLTLDVNKTMVPNVEFLKSCGIPLKQIIRYLSCFPRFILVKPETVRKSVEKVNEMGLDRSSLNYIYAVAVVSSQNEEVWDLKLKTLQNFGFTEDEILNMFKRAPPVFSVSEEKIRNVIELLLATGRYSRLCIFKNPKSLTYSIEMRYKPRLHALEMLEKKNLIKNWPRLGAISNPSNKQFFERYIYPHLNEIGDEVQGWVQ